MPNGPLATDELVPLLGNFSCSAHAKVKKCIAAKKNTNGKSCVRWGSNEPERAENLSPLLRRSQTAGTR